MLCETGGGMKYYVLCGCQYDYDSYDVWAKCYAAGFSTASYPVYRIERSETFSIF